MWLIPTLVNPFALSILCAASAPVMFRLFLIYEYFENVLLTPAEAIIAKIIAGIRSSIVLS